MSDEPCVFCAIANEEAPAKVIDRWPDSIAIEPLNPVTEGHILVLPRVHVSSFVEQPAITGLVMQRAALIARRRWFEVRGQHAFNLITSAGEDATQTVFHLHVHLVPRRPGDGLHLPWTGQHD